jgi:Holliday junction resolvasome RuvABC endonuclease subunit
VPLVTLGCDVGSRYVGWAVLDDTLLAHGVWDLHETPDGWTPEPWLVSKVGRESWQGLRGTFQVALLAVEVFHWRRSQPVIPEAALIQRRVGALFALGRPHLTVVGYSAATWMQAIMGWLPEVKLWGSKAWKGQVRDQVGRMLDYRWPPVKPGDPRFAHDSDAAGLALYARDVALMAARIRARERR